MPEFAKKNSAELQVLASRKLIEVGNSMLNGATKETRRLCANLDVLVFELRQAVSEESIAAEQAEAARQQSAEDRNKRAA